MSLGDSDVAAVEFVAVEFGHGFLSCLVVGHFDETVAFAASGLAVGDDTGGGDFAVLAEEVAELVFLGAEAQFCYKDVHSLKDRFKKGNYSRRLGCW